MSSDQNKQGSTLKKHKTLREEAAPWYEELSGAFRGIAASMSGTIAAKTTAAKAAAAKAAAAKGAAVKAAAAKSAGAKVSAKTAVRAIGENRPLAFASEGAVAGESMIPRFVYYGAWALSGAAILADIYTKQDDAPEGKKWQTAVYWTSFHIPASLVVPAMIIHQIVHQVEHVVENPKGFAKAWSPRAKAVAPVAAALLSIVPVVPAVDTVAERIMEPTVGAYLGLEFEHHHGKAD